jgi:HD-GYP domain-containing protein (c-di-GMP phosphodiesterase class II)
MDIKNHFTEQTYIKKQIQDLIPGDIILHPIYRSDGLMLVKKNKKLTVSLINIVKKHALPAATVLVSPSAKIFEEFVQGNNYISAEFKEDLNQLMREYTNTTGSQVDRNAFDYNDINSDTINPIANMLSASPYWASFEDKLESEYLKKRASLVKRELLTLFINNQTFINLFNRIKDYDDVLLIHSINTACISLMVGLTLELSNEDLLDLAVAALFLNIGFTELPKEDFKSFLKTQEYNKPAMKKHLEVFSKMTLESPLLRKKSIIHGILDHHEFYNGKGYPSGKKGEEISLFGRILNITHSYDGLVGGYNYTTGVLPFEAFRTVYENKYTIFDNNILNIFLYRTTYFKLDGTLLLPNGIRGKIIGFDDFLKNPHLPIIQFKNGSIVNLLNNSIK